MKFLKIDKIIIVIKKLKTLRNITNAKNECKTTEKEL